MNAKFETVKQLEDGYYLLTTKHCQTCEKLKLMLNEIDLNVNICELDAQIYNKLCNDFSIIGTPCLVEVKSGIEMNRIYGKSTKDKLIAFFRGDL